jgi:hypothetical protein
VNNKPNSNAVPSGKTPFQKFQALAKGLIAVPKAEVDRKAKAQGLRRKNYPNQRKQS